MPLPLPVSLSPLRHPAYRAFWLAHTSSNFGLWIQTVAATWLMVSITPRGDLVAMIQTAATLPAIVFSVFGGILSDLWNRRSVLLVGQAIVLVGTVALVLLQGLDGMTPWLLLACNFIVGSGIQMNLPVVQSAVGELVPYEDIPHAVALNSIGFNLARSLGPAIGGASVLYFDITYTFIICSLLHFFMMPALLRWKRRPKADDLPPEPLFQAFMAGFHYLRHAQVAYVPMIRCSAFTCAASAIWALLPLLAQRNPQGGPVLYGFMLACLSIGAILGALFYDRTRQRLRGESLISTGVGLLGMTLIVLTFTTELLLVAPALLIAGMVWLSVLTTLNVTVQLSVAEWVKTRMMALYYVAHGLGMALGSWCWGALTETYDLETALVAATIFTLACLSLAVIFPMPTELPNDLSPFDQALPVTLPEDIVPGRDTVMIQVEYEISAERIEEFRKAMQKLRSIRLRDGAEDWGLHQNANNIHIWIEIFSVSSWTEYIRRRKRITKRDWSTFEHVRSFHIGADKPRVVRLIRRILNRFTAG